MNSFIERNRESIYREHREFIKGGKMVREKVQNGKLAMTRGAYKIRNEEIWQLRKLGRTYQEIAGEYNISRELETLQDMRYLTDTDFLRQRNFGRNSLNELKCATRELKWAS